MIAVSGRRRASAKYRGGGGGGGSSIPNTDTPPPALGGGSGLRLYTALGHGIYTDAGVTLASAAGQSVYRWKDYSGNNNHCERPTTNKPTVNASANLVFPSSAFLGVPNAVVSGVGDGELFMLLKSDTDTQPGTNCGGWYFGGGNVGVYGNFTGEIDEPSGTTGRYAFTPALPTYTRTVWHVYSVRTSGALWEALRNNTALFTVSSGNAVDWGTNPDFGVSAGTGLWYTGQCGALVFYAGARSSGERASIVSTLLGMAPP